MASRAKIISRASVVLIGLAAALTGCQQESKKQSGAKPAPYAQYAQWTVRLKGLDHFNQVTAQGYGFYLSPGFIVTHLSLIQGSFKVQAGTIDGKAYENTIGYVSVDAVNDLVLLQSVKRPKVNFYLENSPVSSDSVYSLFRKDDKLFLQKGKVDHTNQLSTKFDCGKPVFSFNHALAGMAGIPKPDGTQPLIPLHTLQSLLKVKEQPRSVYELRRQTNKVYPSYTQVEGIELQTDLGNITIRQSHKTPEYRDNFIRLACDEFYDSLLIHRVIQNFLIQTGAADSKFASQDDVVGWQGPGYTLPMQIHPSLFHHRGAVAASKLPPDRNPHNRSDGSQFYLITGRIFSHQELNELEQKTGRKFSETQRQVYTTTGGAPHLDGEYTVFGEVVSGMEVVDKIAKVEVKGADRPTKDIRLKSVRILKTP